MTLAAAAALEHTSSLIFREHALDLKEQGVFRGLADRPIQEYDLGAGARELLNQDGLVHIAAGQAIGRMHIDDINRGPGDGIAQALQGGPDQTGAAVTLVNKAKLSADFTAIGGCPRHQVIDLAINGVTLRLLVGGYSGIDRHPERIPGPASCWVLLHQFPPSTARSASREPGAIAVAGDAGRHPQGSPGNCAAVHTAPPARGAAPSQGAGS